jgi:hypothetical protein
VKEERDAFTADKNKVSPAAKIIPKNRRRTNTVKDESKEDVAETKVKPRRVAQKDMVKMEPTDEDDVMSSPLPTRKKRRAPVKAEPRDTRPIVESYEPDMKVERIAKREDTDPDTAMPEQMTQRPKKERAEMPIKKDEYSSAVDEKPKRRGKATAKTKVAIKKDPDSEEEGQNAGNMPQSQTPVSSLPTKQEQRLIDARRPRPSNIIKSDPDTKGHIGEPHVRALANSIKPENGQSDSDEDTKYIASLQTKSTNKKKAKKEAPGVVNPPKAIRRSTRNK